MENTVIEIVKESALSTVTYSPLLDSLAAVAAVVIPLCFRRVRDYVIKKCKDFTKHKELYHSPCTEDLTRYFNIDTALAVLQDNTKADRVSIYQFHNGEEFSVHNPIFKFTCSHEYSCLGIKPDSDIIKRLVVSNYMDFIGPLASDNFIKSGVSRIKAKDTGDISRILKYDIGEMHYGPFRWLCDSQGVDVMYAVPIMAAKKKDSQLGVICFQYLDKKSDVFDTVNLKDICEKIMRIQHILNGEA